MDGGVTRVNDWQFRLLPRAAIETWLSAHLRRVGLFPTWVAPGQVCEAL